FYLFVSSISGNFKVKVINTRLHDNDLSYKSMLYASQFHRLHKPFKKQFRPE
ncbi:311_t:CDS:2, partial [Entrophospora sp. SA101]